MIPAGVFILVITSALLWRGVDGLFLNMGYVALIKAGLESGSYAGPAMEMLDRAVATQPSAQWGRALLARWRGDRATSLDRLTNLLTTNRPRMRLMRALEPDNAELAALAWRQQPAMALAAFWYADTASVTDKAAAIEAYEAGLRLDPRDGFHWVQLGRLYRENGQFESALAAFGQGCLHWDHGKNGCWQAGVLAEELGLAEQAADYYRRALVQLPGYAPALRRLEALSP